SGPDTCLPTAASSLVSTSKLSGGAPVVRRTSSRLAAVLTIQARRKSAASSAVSTGQATDSTWWPSDSSSSAVADSPARASGCGSPNAESALNPIRSRPGSRPTSALTDRSGAARWYGAVGSGPTRQSSAAALSRTVREITPSTAAPWNCSDTSGPEGTSPRPGLRPNRPHQEAGIRIEPPPSLAAATGTIPAATAAAEPPEEPPGERLRSHGLWVGPKASGSVTGLIPNSGELVRPNTTSPASSQRCTTSAVSAEVTLRSAREPADETVPAHSCPRSLSRNGTPASGPLSSPFARSRAISVKYRVMALSFPLTA